MSELEGTGYGDHHSEEEVPSQHGTGPGEGPLDSPETTGTHRGWGDPQVGEEIQQEEDED